MPTRRRTVAVLILLGTFGLATWCASKLNSGWIDWSCYQQAALQLVSGRSPYAAGCFVNPPWILIPLIPLALLPNQLGGAVLLPLSLAAFALAAYTMKAKPGYMGLFMTSAPIMQTVALGQIDGLLLAGMALPPVWGLLLLLAKPQLGLGIGVYYAAEAWRNGGIRTVLRTFGPVVICYGISFLVFGFYPLHGGYNITGFWNRSLWPWSIPFGLVALWLSVSKRKINFAMVAGPLLSPYVGYQSWSVAILAAISLRPEFIGAALGSWAPLVLSLIP